MAVALALLLPCACGRPEGFRPERTFADSSSLAGLVWRCHTVFAHASDSGIQGGDGVLAVTAHAGPYPGMEWSWLVGDWRGHDSLCFAVRAGDSSERDFMLSIWDGKEPYEAANRHAARFRIGSSWNRQCLPLEGGLRAANGREMDLGRVRRVVFYAAEDPAPLAFRLAWTRLVPVSPAGYRRGGR